MEFERRRQNGEPTGYILESMRLLKRWGKLKPIGWQTLPYYFLRNTFYNEEVIGWISFLKINKLVN
jgi:hypothetical protein